MEAFETFEHEGITCELHYDELAGNPYTENNNLGALLIGPRLAREYDLGETCERIGDASSAAVARWLTLCEGYAVAVPFTFADYGSGGARAWLTTPDNEQASGFLAVRDTEGMSAEDAEQTARAEFEEFASYIEGGACGYIVAPGADDEESCWGYYDADACRDEARSAAACVAYERRVNEEPRDIAEVLANL